MGYGTGRRQVQVRVQASALGPGAGLSRPHRTGVCGLAIGWTEGRSLGTGGGKLADPRGRIDGELGEDVALAVAIWVQCRKMPTGLVKVPITKWPSSRRNAD